LIGEGSGESLLIGECGGENNGRLSEDEEDDEEVGDSGDFGVLFLVFDLVFIGQKIDVIVVSGHKKRHRNICYIYICYYLKFILFYFILFYFILIYFI
jgi:hypothetical protein